MAASKPKKLGTWTHEKSGITVEYFINGTRFECTVLEQKLTAPEASVLREQVFDKLEHWMTMEWFPIIEITCSDDSNSYRDEPEGAGCKIACKRFYLSRTPAGKVMSVDWDVDPEHRKAKMSGYGREELALTRLPLKAPFKKSGGYRDDESYLIDYDEAVWETVQQMIKALIKIRVEVGKLFKSREGIAKLAEAGPRLLLGGGGKAKG